MQEPNTIFLNEVPVETLVTISKTRDQIYCGEISKNVDTTYAHATKTISKLKEHGLIEYEHSGRKKYLELTEEGEEYAEIFQKIVNLEKEKQEISKLTEGSVIAD